jgi:hypothetical protein
VIGLAILAGGSKHPFRRPLGDIGKPPANVRFPLEIVWDWNAKKRNPSTPDASRMFGYAAFMQNLFAGTFERNQRRNVDVQPGPDAEEKPTEDILMRLRPNT